jgi:GNAT superfamily N-acetyltransferase
MSISIRTGSLDEVLALEESIPEFAKRTALEELRARLDAVSLILVATLQGVPVGYKVGYASSTNDFYSWLGAVHPQYRGKGIAQALLLYQEQWAYERDFKTITVKSANRFPAMLSLLIANHYQIVGIENSGDADAVKIVFRKLLTPRQQR